MVKYEGVCKHYLFMLDTTMHSLVDLKKKSEEMPRRVRKTLQGACKEKEARIQDAIRAIREGKSIRSAAIEFGIAYSTLQDHYSGKNKFTLQY